MATSRTCGVKVMAVRESQLHHTHTGTKFLGSCLDANMQTESGLGWEGHVSMVAVLPAMQLNPYTLQAAQQQEHIPALWVPAALCGAAHHVFSLTIQGPNAHFKEHNYCVCSMLFASAMAWRTRRRCAVEGKDLE